jgi:hypothetical protein
MKCSHCNPAARKTTIRTASLCPECMEVEVTRLRASNEEHLAAIGRAWMALGVKTPKEAGFMELSELVAYRCSELTRLRKKIEALRADIGTYLNGAYIQTTDAELTRLRKIQAAIPSACKIIRGLVNGITEHRVRKATEFVDFHDPQPTHEEGGCTKPCCGGT